MIHQLLNLTRPLIIPDTETTGTRIHEDRIVELGFQLWSPEGLIKEWRTLVRPGIPIPPSATEVHGITDAMVNACRACGHNRDSHAFDDAATSADLFSGRSELDPQCVKFKSWPRFADIAPNIAGSFRDCDYAGKNVRFDLQILAAEFARAKVEWSYDGARIVDIDRLEQIALPRTLTALHEKYTGRPHDGAHGALSDARASATVIVRQLEVHDCALPRDLDALHRLQWPGWIDGEGKFRFVDGVPCFGRWGKYAGRPMADPEINRPGRNGGTYWDFILKGEFAPEVKRLAADAKLGKFPEEK